MLRGNDMRIRLSCLVLAMVSVAAAGEPRDKMSVEEAIRSVASSSFGTAWGNLSPFETQVYYRLMCLQGPCSYEFESKHADTWKASLTDPKQNIYARICAAYFLPDDDREMREF